MNDSFSFINAMYLLINPPYLVLAIFGLLIGSFISMWSYRLPRGMSILGRSICDTCKRTIGITENVPVIYYLLSRGRCKGCKGKISPRYPLIELFTSFCFVVTAYFFNSLSIVPDIFRGLDEFALPIMLFVLTCLLTAFIVDLEEQILPDNITLILGITILSLLVLAPSPVFFSNILAGFLSFSFFLLIYLVTKGRGMGFGDVKLVFVLGAMLGFQPSLVWLNLAFVSGALVGIFLILTGYAKLKWAIPFGPFLIASAWVSLFFSQDLASWYVSLFT